MALIGHLWTKGPPPPEYVDLILCRDVYHCLPGELDAQDAARIEEHLLCMAVEAEVREMRQRLGR